jgi:hypothetical protein
MDILGAPMIWRQFRESAVLPALAAADRMADCNASDLAGE